MLTEKISSIISEKVLPVIITNGIAGYIETGIFAKDSYIKRKEVGFGVIDSIKGSIDETKRKLIADYKGIEFTPDIKAIEFLD